MNFECTFIYVLYFRFIILRRTNLNYNLRPDHKIETARFMPDSDFERPKPGDVVTIVWDRFSQTGNFVAPRIVRLRRDLEWDDVLRGDARKPLGNSKIPSISIPLTSY